MFHVNIDLSGLAGLKEFESEARKACESAARDLAAMTHSKAVELAGERLHSRRQMFVDSLSIHEDSGVSIVSLSGSARWIDDGMEPHSMLDDLLKSPKAHHAKDGSVYLVVPFEHGPGKGASNSPASQAQIVETVKAEMKKRKIPWAKIERDDQGRPKLGKLHSFDVNHAPLKTDSGPGQGWGAVGDVRQGPNERQKVGGGPGGGGIPFLQGVAVYQKATEGGKTKRSVMTFRIASSKHEGRWRHPGLDPVNIIDDTYKWAMEQVESVITPKLIDKILSRL